MGDALEDLFGNFGGPVAAIVLVIGAIALGAAVSMYLRRQKSKRKAKVGSERKVPTTVAGTQRELSGRVWVDRFPGSKSLGDLVESFRAAVEKFLRALSEAGAEVTINATYRPPERAYLMHYCWEIAHGSQDTRSVPRMPGVEIEWVHKDAGGGFDRAATRNAATDMVDGYGMKHVAALHSRHTERKAIDLSIEWTGALQITDANGNVVAITTEPHDCDNSILHQVGRTFGVVKLVIDKPHWSTDGH